MTQSIVQGSEDPLLVLDHQGGSGNPSFLIQQDETAVAYIWWDQANQVFNMGPASAFSPALSIASNGTARIGDATINNLVVGDLLVNGGGIAVDKDIRAGTATINTLEVGDVTVTSGLVVDQNMQVGTATINGLEVGNVTVTGGIVVDQNMDAGTASINGLEVGNVTVNGGIVANQDMLVMGTVTTNGLVVQNGSRVTNGMDVDNMLVTGTVTAGNYLSSSSREIKENIVDFSSQEALEVLEHLSPVKFHYKADDAKKAHIGFIAEDVPQSVASSDGKGISLTDIVSVLTRAVKEQQKTINTLSEKCHSLELAMNRARR